MDLLIISRWCNACQTVKPGLPAARLASALPGFVATDEFLGSGNVLLLRLVLLLPDGAAFASQPDVLPVIPGVPLADSGLELQDVVGGVLEEAAVVRHDQHAGPGEGQEALPPLHRLGGEGDGRVGEQQPDGGLQPKPG